VRAAGLPAELGQTIGERIPVHSEPARKAQRTRRHGEEAPLVADCLTADVEQLDMLETTQRAHVARCASGDEPIEARRRVC